MSIFLFDEQPIFANKVLAEELGLNEAIILQQINYWIELNKKTGKNFFEGKYWTYNSIRSWHEKEFSYMSIDTVRRTFNKLEKMGYLIIGNFNKDPRDQTKWYTVNDEKLDELYYEVQERKLKKEKEVREEAAKKPLQNAFMQNAQMEKSPKNRLPNAFMQNAQMGNDESAKCIYAKCTNGIGQNAPMQYGNLHKPLPEITTEINTDINSIYLSDNTTNIVEENSNSEMQTERKKERISLPDAILDNCVLDYYSYNDVKEFVESRMFFNHFLEDPNIFVAERAKNVRDAVIDIYCTPDEFMFVGKQRYLTSLVKARLLETNESVFSNVVHNLVDNAFEVQNIEPYVKKTLINSYLNQGQFYVDFARERSETNTASFNRKLPSWYTDDEEEDYKQPTEEEILEFKRNIRELKDSGRL